MKIHFIKHLLLITIFISRFLNNFLIKISMFRIKNKRYTLLQKIYVRIIILHFQKYSLREHYDVTHR